VPAWLWRGFRPHSVTACFEDRAMIQHGHLHPARERAGGLFLPNGARNEQAFSHLVGGDRGHHHRACRRDIKHDTLFLHQIQVVLQMCTLPPGVPCSCLLQKESAM